METNFKMEYHFYNQDRYENGKNEINKLTYSFIYLGYIIREQYNRLLCKVFGHDLGYEEVGDVENGPKLDCYCKRCS